MVSQVIRFSCIKVCFDCVCCSFVESLQPQHHQCQFLLGQFTVAIEVTRLHQKFLKGLQISCGVVLKLINIWAIKANCYYLCSIATGCIMAIRSLTNPLISSPSIWPLSFCILIKFLLLIFKLNETYTDLIISLENFFNVLCWDCVGAL